MPLLKSLTPILLLAAFPAPLQAQTAPATTAPAAPDYSTPRKAVQSFLRAQDDATLRDALIIPAESAAAVDAFLSVMVVTINLQKAAEAQFGGSAARFFSTTTNDQLAARIKAVETADLQIKGDSATIALPADETSRQSSATITLKKTGTEWKINADSLFGIDGATKAETAHRVELANTIKSVTDKTIADISARKFNSASEAYQEYWTRAREAIGSLSPGATRPATLPVETRP